MRKGKELGRRRFLLLRCEVSRLSATTYRVSEHWQTGVMTRHVPWLLEMVPQRLWR